MRLPTPQLTYANVAATLALVLATTTGTAYAAGLANNSVKSRHIATNAVVARHIAPNAIDNGHLRDNAVRGPEIAEGAVGASELAADSVGGSELGPSSVTSDHIVNETIVGSDIKEGAISSTRMTDGVRDLLFSPDSGTIIYYFEHPEFDVTSTSWPGGAPTTGSPIAITWSQPAETIDVVSVRVRAEFESSCSATASSPGRGIDIKAVDESNRVITASTPSRTDGSNYNGNGTWSQQVALPGVSYRAPFGSDLADSPSSFIDYFYLPLELGEFYAGTGSSNRAVRFYFKASSSNCDVNISQVRSTILRYHN